MAVARRKPREDKLPDFVAPQLSELVKEAPTGPDWAHEIKYDGYRMHAWLDRGEVRLLTRTGLDWTDHYPAIVAALHKLPARRAYLDGELCAVRPDGTTSFSLMQNAHSRRASLVYFLFDCLHLDGQDVMKLALVERKARVAALLEGSDKRLQYSAHIAGSGLEFYREACRLKVEGMVSKRLDAPYVPGNRGLWRKTKCVNREEFVIVGWTDPEGGRPAIGALLLGYYLSDGRLVYAGRAGSGMSDAELRRIWKKLQPLARDSMPLDAPPPSTSRFGAPLLLSRVHWVRPELVAEVSYLTWTDEGLLRQVVYHGLREDKPARAVIRALPHAREQALEPKPVAAKHRPRGRPSGAVPPENILQLLPDAVVPTQQALVDYWSRVADRALAHLGFRPLKLVRHVKGTTFYHRGKLPPIPASVHTLRIEKAEGGEGVRPWVEDLAGLIGLVEIGAVELHPWGARIEDIERPDRLVFDLDPGPGIGWDFVVETALALRDMLRGEGFEPWPKLTGGKGLHLMIDIVPEMKWPEAHAVTQTVARRFAARDPKRYTTTASLARRAGRLFIDYLRNGRGTTAIGAWSPRARPGFPIAAPVGWDEIARGLRSDAFTMDKPPAAGRRRGRH